MNNLIKNYILWPIIALLITAVIYLVLVVNTHKLLNIFPYGEKLLWQHFVSKNIEEIDHFKRHNLQAIIDQLPANLLPKKYPKITLIISNDNEINAFAAPEGRIILTSGLLNATENEDALLFAIGHEIGHLTRGDHLYELSRMIVTKTYNIVTWSSLFTELMMTIDSNKIKKAEFLADQHALKIIHNHYGNIKGMTDLLQILKFKNKLNNYGETSLTHPNINQRLEKLNFFIKKTCHYACF